MKKKLLILLAVLLVGGGVFWFYNSTMSKPKVIFATSIEETYTMMADMMNDMRNNELLALGENGPFSIQSRITLELEGSEDLGELNDFLNQSGLDVIFQYDEAGKQLFLDLGVDVEGERLLEAKVYAKEDLIYVLVEEFFDKYIGIDGINLFVEDETDEKVFDDIEYLTELVKDLFLESFKDEYFSVEKAEITINNESYNVNKNTLEITDARLKEMLEHIMTGVKDDDKAVLAIVNIINFNEFTEVTKDEIVADINEAINELADEQIIEGKIIYNIYTKGFNNEILKHEILLLDDDFEMTFEYYKYEDNDVLIKEFRISDGEGLEIVFQIKEIDENTTKYQLVGTENGNVMLDVALEVEVVKTVVVANEEIKFDINLKLVIKVDDEEIAANVNVDMTVKAIDAVDVPADDMLIKYEEMAEEDRAMLDEIIGQFLFGFSGDAMYYEDPEWTDEWLEDDWSDEDWFREFDFDAEVETW